MDVSSMQNDIEDTIGAKPYVFFIILWPILSRFVRK